MLSCRMLAFLTLQSEVTVQHPWWKVLLLEIYLAILCRFLRNWHFENYVNIFFFFFFTTARQTNRTKTKPKTL